MNGNVRAWQKLAIGIGDVDFGQERVRRLVDGIRSPRQCAPEGPAGIFVECQGCDGTQLGSAGIHFRNRDKHTEGVDRRKME